VGDRDKGDTALYRVPVLGGPSSMAAYDVGPAGFSPDRRRMAFIRQYHAENRLIVADADGTNERALATRREPEFFRGGWNAPAWSPDGKTIVCPVSLNDERGQYETIIGVDVEDGSQRPLTSARWNFAGQPAWLADGSGLLVTASESANAPAQVWHVALKSGEATRITNDHSKAVMEWPGALSIPFLVEIQTLTFDLQTFVNCRMSPQSCGGNMTPKTL